MGEGSQKWGGGLLGVMMCDFGGFLDGWLKQCAYGEYFGVSVERSGEKGEKDFISKLRFFEVF